jgi:hypothetical protein
MFSENIGFWAQYEKQYYKVKPLNFLDPPDSHIPDVTKFLIDKFYLADAKKTDGGEIFAVNF